MLSRFSLCGGQSLKKCVLKFQPASAITTSAATSSNAAKKDFPPEFPPPGSKRDHINFPRPMIRERPPPVRLGFIPDSWFQLFYPKTGYTGPYMFIASVATYMYSKEIIVYEHNMVHCYAFIFLCWFVHNKFGDQIGDAYNKFINNEIKMIDGEQEMEKETLRNNIQFLEGKKSMKDAIVEIGKAKTEIVQLQLEVSYRERIMEAYKMIKNKLDCQVELENVERRAAQRNIVNYVMSNVMKSITPEFEKNVLQTCINDLNTLASKA